MNKLSTIAFILTGLVASAQAALTSGVEAGYLVDGEEAYFSARFGGEIKAATSYSHQIEVEVGYTRETDSGLKLSLTPVTVNYRLESTGENKLGYYFGLGAGTVHASVSGFGFSSSDSALALQSFAGVKYRVSPNASLNLGAKYLWFGKADFFGANARIGDDVALTAGVSIRF
jgi:opacity protein-like surface antigen